MIQRQMAEWLKIMAREYAVVSIMGPRQSGKTTLAKMLFPDYGYVNLEDPDLRRAAEADGADFMDKHPAPLIIDEVQRVPELLSRIQVKVDANPTRKAAYILTGLARGALAISCGTRCHCDADAAFNRGSRLVMSAALPRGTRLQGFHAPHLRRRGNAGIPLLQLPRDIRRA